ncbi:MAG: DNA polymerase III subunit gamma/tau [Legionellaceae bacterium]|nr:DNA polymerase III subunit gamma/tau [Legionellaceae bacterium]
MSYLALARKWRPRTFSELLGQPHLTTALINSLDQQRIHHAYLFTGTRGVGKTSIARLFAKALNCEQGISSQPCLQCDACLAVEQGRFVDLIEIDGASKTRVEDTRDILENVQYAPTSGRYKIYLIDEVHMLSQHSFNALLKTLEEPPAHVKFLLATTDPQKLPVTVLSRCLQFNLKHVSEPIIAEHLQHILQQETIPFEIEAVSLLAKAARGSVRDGLSLLDQAIASCNTELTIQPIKNMLGFTQHDYAIQILDALSKNNPQELITISHKINNEGGNFLYVLDEILHYLHQIAINQALPNPGSLLELSTEMKGLSSQFIPEDVQLMYQIALKGKEDLSCAPTMAIGFEMILLRMYTFKPAPTQTTKLKPVIKDISIGSVDNPDFDVPRLVRKIQHDLSLCDKLSHESKSLDPADKPQDVGLQKVDCKHTLDNSKINDSSEKQPIEQQLKAEIKTEAKSTVTTDEISWSTILPQLNLRGLALIAAENTQLKHRSPGYITLQIEKAHQSLFTKPVQTRIEEALSTFYNEKIQITLESSSQAPSSPALEKKMTQEKNLQQAEIALHSDPFFQQLQSEFSAELLKNSITAVKTDD